MRAYCSLTFAGTRQTNVPPNNTQKPIQIQETSGFQVDWTVFGPGAVVGVGVLVLLLGVLGLARRQR